jgi:aminoglycoside phosphotransferase (APT) family kinase protein
MTIPSLPPPGTPPAEVAVDLDLARALLERQHPDLAGLPLEVVDSGWDNVIVRVGDALALRLPRRSLAASLVEHEQRWLPELAAGLPLPVPAPVRTGQPGSGYPWCWSVVPWLPGSPADLVPPEQSEAAVLGGFLRALHRPAPPGAPRNPFRGGALRDRHDAVTGRLARLEEHGVDVAAARALWAGVVDLPVDAGPVWVHGDLHARNLLVEDGRLAAVIDWGDLTSGDPATDLAAAWLLFEPAAHDALLDAYGRVAEPTWRRATGWAVFMAVTMLDAGLAGDDRFEVAGRRALARLAG